MMFRSFLIAAALLSVFAIQPASAGVLDFFFPTLKDEQENPSETLQAPFADKSAETVEGKENPKSMVPLNLPHRANGDISTWVVTAVSDVTTFDVQTYKENDGAVKAYFDEGGLKQYEAFLETHKISGVLASGQYNIRSYVRDVPILLNEGAVQGRYRWLYDVPLMLSYLKRDVVNYKGVEPVNQNMSVRVQIGRSSDADNEIKLQVERWEGKVKKTKKK